MMIPQLRIQSRPAEELQPCTMLHYMHSCRLESDKSVCLRKKFCTALLNLYSGAQKLRTHLEIGHIRYLAFLTKSDRSTVQYSNFSKSMFSLQNDKHHICN